MDSATIYTSFAGGFTEKSNTGGTDKNSKTKSGMNSLENSWATTSISDAELGMTGYIIFRKDRIGRRGGDVIL